MTPEGIVKLKDHEGLRLLPYTDTVGKLSIGWGHNLTDVGISREEATLLLEHDIAHATASARANFDWVDGLDPVRQDVIVILVFNMGVGGVNGFKNMIQAIKDRNWTQAAWELSNSQWGTQVGRTRRESLCIALEKGSWDGYSKERANEI